MARCRDSVEAEMTSLNPVLAELRGQIGHGERFLVKSQDPRHHHGVDEAEALEFRHLIG